MDEAYRLREQQEIDLEKHLLQTLEKERKQREEAMDAELNNEKEILTLVTNGASQNNSVKPKLLLKMDEEFYDEEGIGSKRKRRILVPIEYSDNEDDENKTEEKKKKIKELDELVFYFVINHLRNKKPAEDLTKEMMMKLWRKLIFETESKARKI
ncbi:hypothetical protein RhiirA5_366969 [Rhizophagus irregularis]|uniref:Uncharacterized protein n=1 Tax=Rhizophagus irregularis TaxID=588596 RepID=A0A2N0NV57_9GLOM|nr:hypothetical protein RhiirA5_366969 [Rhizophagus irregularis]